MKLEWAKATETTSPAKTKTLLPLSCGRYTGFKNKAGLKYFVSAGQVVKFFYLVCQKCSTYDDLQNFFFFYNIKFLKIIQKIQFTNYLLVVVGQYLFFDG